MRIIVWGLHRDAEDYGDRVPATRYLWTAIRESEPRLQVWFVLYGEICEMRWVEDVA